MDWRGGTERKRAPRACPWGSITEKEGIQQQHILKIVVNKNQTFAGLHKVAKFLMEIPLRDYTNMRKLLLMGRVYPYTMVRYRRLSQIYECSALLEKKNIQGAFVECGVWRGGAAAIMAYNAERAQSGRKIWLFDSFEGLPEPTVEDGKEAEVFAKGSIRIHPSHEKKLPHIRIISQGNLHKKLCNLV